ncbi:Tumor necrosis factor receptor superfamily member 19L [Oryzias melastigma]|uniref:Tumor necrosis factor receptor superfamily member 19L n=1 Tax=Oryzias melastigma TaxID=30732 RepID=A0A834F4T9_ORYME|nr:Tumor necrosis factor receptor superfamily member 19L [Oryzias melastigma]
MKNHLCCSALVLLAMFGCGSAAVLCTWAEGCECLQCPAGQEPSKACEKIQTPAEEVQCQLCPSGSFSDALNAELCRPHTICESIGRKVVISGTASSDAVCGACLPGFHFIAADQASAHGLCLKADSHVRMVRTVGKGPSSAAGLANSTVVRSAEEKTTEYAVFALVPVFCVMGLLGILICNILKKKGYNCTAEKEEEMWRLPHRRRKVTAAPTCLMR